MSGHSRGSSCPKFDHRARSRPIHRMILVWHNRRGATVRKTLTIFAIEDNEPAVVYEAGDHWFGEVIAIPAPGEVRTFTVRVEQLADTESYEVQNEGPDVVEMF